MPKFFDPVNYGKKSAHNVTIYGSVITLSGSSGTANITINGYVNETIATYSSSTTTTASNWVTANYDYYYALGYKVSAAAGVITVNPRYGYDSVNRINATIANVTGNLTGTLAGRLQVDFAKGRNWRVTFGQNITVLAPKNAKDGEHIRIELKATGGYTVTWTAAAWYFAGGTEPSQTSTSTDVYEGVFQKAFAARYHTVTLSGSSGTASLKYGGYEYHFAFNGTLNQTVVDFATDYADDYAEVGVTLTGASNPLIITDDLAAAAEYFAVPQVHNLTGNLAGAVVTYPAGRVLMHVKAQDIKQ
jgi:hypothetical protein